MNYLVLTLCLILSNISFAITALTKLNDKNIYGCFNEIKTSKYESTTLILRNDSTISNDFIVNEKENKNSVLIIANYKSDIRESFEVSPLKFEGKDTFIDSKDGWDPKLYDKTFFTSKGNLKAFSIQSSDQNLKTAKYSEFAAKELSLVCTSDKKLIKALYFKLILSE